MRQRVRRRYCLTLALCVLSFVGCSDPGEPELTTRTQRVLPTPLVRDSAGVRIIEYPMLGAMPPALAALPNPLQFTLADLPPALRLESQPFLDLGGIKANEQEEFDARHPFLSATRLANGTIVVNDYSSLKFFTPTGQFIRAVGRRGSGPLSSDKRERSA